MGRLNGTVAVVTGAASGLGQAAARRLAADGADVVAVDLAAMDDAQTQLAAGGREVLVHRCDVSSEEDVRSLADAVGERFGRCDILVNCVGIYPFTAFRMPDLKLAPAEIDAIVALFDAIAGPEAVAATEAAAPAQFPDEIVSRGQLLYFLKCTECHNLGSVVPTPAAKRQGPDLIQVQQRLRYDWIPQWVKNPVAVYPGAAMVDTNLDDAEIEAVRAFLWKTSGSAPPKQ